jgi:hypothetical protein
MGVLKVRIARPMVARHCHRRIADLIVCDSINKRTGMPLAAQDGLAQVDYSESGQRQDLDSESGALQRVSLAATGQVRRTRTLRVLKFRFGSI